MYFLDGVEKQMDEKTFSYMKIYFYKMEISDYSIRIWNVKHNVKMCFKLADDKIGQLVLLRKTDHIYY